MDSDKGGRALAVLTRNRSSQHLPIVRSDFFCLRRLRGAFLQLIRTKNLLSGSFMQEKRMRPLPIFGRGRWQSARLSVSGANNRCQKGRTASPVFCLRSATFGREKQKTWFLNWRPVFFILKRTCRPPQIFYVSAIWRRLTQSSHFFSSYLAIFGKIIIIETDQEPYSRASSL